MTETPQPTPGRDEEPSDRPRDVAHAGGGRTHGETDVDDDLGRGDLPGE